jgi:hypothetical protein
VHRRGAGNSWAHPHRQPSFTLAFCADGKNSSKVVTTTGSCAPAFITLTFDSGALATFTFTQHKNAITLTGALISVSTLGNHSAHAIRTGVQPWSWTAPR